MRKTLFCIFIIILYSYHHVKAQNNDKDLIFYVPFTEGCDDISSNKYKSIIFGTKLVGKNNKACLFNGLDEYISYPNVDILNQTIPITISCWIAPFAKRPYDAWISKSDDKFVHSQWRIGFGEDPDKQVGLTIFKNDWINYWKNMCLIPDRKWTHIVFTIDTENKKASFYRNGNLLISWDISKYNDFSGPLFIAHQCDDLSFFHGMIDEIRIYSAILTQKQIENLFKEFEQSEKAEILPEYYSDNKINTGKNNDYNIPECLYDGINVAPIYNFTLDTLRIFNLINDLASGEFQDIYSLLIAKNDTLILEKYFQGADALNLHTMFSVTKSIVSLSVGKAIELGYIHSVDDNVMEYLPEVDSNKVAKGANYIKIRHLLTMTSGMDFSDKVINVTTDYLNHASTYLYKTNPVNPGSRFVYQSSDPNLISHIIYNATKLPLDKFTEKYLFSPLQINNYKWVGNYCGLPIGSSGLSLTPRDMLKIGLMVKNGGVFNGHQVINQTYIEESTKKQTDYNDQSDGYGYFWWTHAFKVNDTYYPSFSARGALGQYIFVIPSLDMVVVWTSRNEPPYKTKPFELTEYIILPAFVK